MKREKCELKKISQYGGNVYFKANPKIHNEDFG